MEKINIKDFKNNTGLIIVTILLAFLVAFDEVTKPKYFTSGEAVILTLISWPLVSWWFMAFWNRILTKIFQLKQISYGVAFILLGALTLILS